MKKVSNENIIMIYSFLYLHHFGGQRLFTDHGTKHELLFNFKLVNWYSLYGFLTQNTLPKKGEVPPGYKLVKIRNSSMIDYVLK